MVSNNECGAPKLLDLAANTILNNSNLLNENEKEVTQDGWFQNKIDKKQAFYRTGGNFKLFKKVQAFTRPKVF